MKVLTLRRRLVFLLSGAAIGNVIVFAATPILTRIYGPQDFGLLAMFVSYSGVLGAVSCLRYDQAIYAPKRKQTALLLVVGGMGCSVFILFILTMILGVFVFQVSETYIGYWAIAVPLAGGLLAVYNLLSNWAVREHNVGLVVGTRIQRAVLQTVMQISFGSFAAFSSGLVIGDIVGRFAGILVIFRRFLSELRSIKVSKRRLWIAMYHYRRFPLLAGPSALVNVVVMQATPILLSLFYSPATAGTYFLVHRLMIVPLALAGQSVAQVLTSDLSQMIANGISGCFRLYLRAVFTLAFTGGALIISLGVFGAPYLPLVLGPEWEDSAAYLLALTPFFTLQFIASPLSNFMNALGRQGSLLLWDICRLLIALPSLVLSATLGLDAVSSLLIFSSVMALFYLILILWLGVIIKVST